MHTPAMGNQREGGACRRQERIIQVKRGLQGKIIQEKRIIQAKARKWDRTRLRGGPELSRCKSRMAKQSPVTSGNGCQE